ncbi:hypothetical protein [Gracilimonas sp.]|uniref:hypothetical protein n=1 Tax=Gracilimonas sp. TaxID=1974203 RepID=UPI002871F844|nr:hypothetical protein [Gracilimonas sp.]
MTIKTQKIIIVIFLVLVCLDLIVIYLDSNSFNALYAGSTAILFGIAWDALNKLQKENDLDS